MTFGVCCQLLIDGKCSIYRSRPSMCRSYDCGYIVESLPYMLRPDQSGVIIDVLSDRIRVVQGEPEIGTGVRQSIDDLAIRHGKEIQWINRC